MASLKIHQTLFLILISSLVFVNADQGLIRAACHGTDSPELCQQCLDSFPGSKYADSAGLAGNIVQCVIVHAEFLQSNMTHSGSRAGVSEDLKAALKSCSEGYSTAVEKNLGNVGGRLKKGEYDGANELISMAVDIQLLCRGNLEESHGWDPEPNIIYEMNSYDDLSQAAMRIIDRI